MFYPYSCDSRCTAVIVCLFFATGHLLKRLGLGYACLCCLVLQTNNKSKQQNTHTHRKTSKKKNTGATLPISHAPNSVIHLYFKLNEHLRGSFDVFCENSQLQFQWNIRAPSLLSMWALKYWSFLVFIHQCHIEIFHVKLRCQRAAGAGPSQIHPFMFAHRVHTGRAETERVCCQEVDWEWCCGWIYT